MDLWSIFIDNFLNIINEHNYYNKLFNFLTSYENNVLLYGSYGFPIDIFIDFILKKKYNSSVLYKTEHTWNKDFIYKYNKYFIEIDLLHPSMPKDLSQLSKFIISIIKNKNIYQERHLFIIKHIDRLNRNDYNSFRIILEQYSNNAYFICTTHKLDKIDIPVKSRFGMFRIPNFTHEEILNIFSTYFKYPLNQYLCEIKTRNIIKAIFISIIEQTEPHMITREFCIFNFPPIIEFVKSLDKKKNNLNNIKDFSYKCFQYNINISDITQDIIKLLPNNKKANFIQFASDIEHKLILTNKGREPIYIEYLLTYLL
jgi:hypothetical protein